MDRENTEKFSGGNRLQFYVKIFGVEICSVLNGGDSFVAKSDEWNAKFVEYAGTRK